MWESTLPAKSKVREEVKEDRQQGDIIEVNHRPSHGTAHDGRVSGSRFQGSVCLLVHDPWTTMDNILPYL